MLTGELPIGRFAPPSQEVQIDVRLDEVVLRALEKEPDLRYQQASELKTEVETIAHTKAGESSGADVLGPPDWKPNLWGPAVIVAIGVSIVMLVVLVALRERLFAVMGALFLITVVVLVSGITERKSRVGKAKIIASTLVLLAILFSLVACVVQHWQAAHRDSGGRPSISPRESSANAVNPAAGVEVSRPVAGEVSDYEEFTGRIEAARTVEVRSRVSGYLDKIHFQAGATVKQGDLLAEIDPRAYQAELARHAADVQLAQLRLKRLAGDLEPAQSLSAHQRNRIAGEQTRAEAAWRAAHEGLNLAKLNLESTKLTAALGGKISRPLIDPGNLVVANITPLATIVSQGAVYVSFNVDERTVLRLGRMAGGKAGRTPVLSVDCGLAEEKGFPHHGQIESMDSQFDPVTGTARWRAVLSNSAGILMPGMFARVRLTTSAPHKALLVPESALGSNQGQRFLYVVNERNVVELRKVEIGQLSDGRRVVREGLSAEDRVVVFGLQRVRPGMSVKPQRTPQPPPPPSFPAVNTKSPPS